MTELKRDDSLEGEVRSYTLQEAAELIGVSETTMRRYVKEGRLVHWRPRGREIRILHNDLVAYIERLKQGGDAERQADELTDRGRNEPAT